MEQLNLELNAELKSRLEAEKQFDEKVSSKIQRVYNDDLLGYTDVNSETGEIVKTKRSVLAPIEQVGVPSGPVDVGVPLVEHFSSSYDIKENLKKLFNNDKQKMASVLYAESDTDDDDALQMLNDDDDDDDDLNRLADSSPYAVGPDGLSNMERYMQEQGHKVEDFRAWLEKKDMIPPELLSLSDEELKSLVASLKPNDKPVSEGEEA